MYAGSERPRAVSVMRVRIERAALCDRLCLKRDVARHAHTFRIETGDGDP